MSKVLLEMSLSLDGFATGPDVSDREPVGRGGERLHDWMFAGRSAAEVEAFQTEHFSGIGAVIVGRRMADLGIGPWGEEPAFHAPVFVVTHRPAETIVKKGGTSYIFVTGGTDEALEHARQAAGSLDVHVSGGPNIARQYLEAGAIDELHLHLVPMLLGVGTRLFDAATPPDIRLRPMAAVNSPLATHLTYVVERAAQIGLEAPAIARWARPAPPQRRDG